MDFTLEELENLVPKKFQAKQIYGWIYQKYITDFQEMSNISKELRQELSEKYYISSMEIINRQVASDGTIKYLFRLQDGRSVETVLIKMRDEKIDKNGDILQQARWTICLSTQVGCKVGCSFCLTAKGGFVRDLTAGEIVEQVVAIKRDINLEHNRKTNIVYMGMGEPLDNLDNLVQAIKIIANQNGLSISPKRQTVSTSGIAPKIDKLGILGLGVNIAISLHAVDDEVRNELIPMNRAFNIQSIIEAIKRYPYDTRKRVMFEYLMIKGVNDSLKDAKKLIKLLQGIKAKINLIYFNPYPGSIYERPSEEDMEKFASYLNSKGLLATIRASRGMDISAACGQLREQHVRISQSS
ncbi:MAG TPA: 23S rRNA (adenine(2503)-C(2))-methyltransferase RlmN [Campylobacterales bacterium]|nr:23S rRNA (adenine(2503)-C(2))-methyltransferase RlmN [Campylobacterales bacterium]